MWLLCSLPSLAAAGCGQAGPVVVDDAGDAGRFDSGPLDGGTTPLDSATPLDGGTYCGDDVPCCPDSWIGEDFGPVVQLPESFIEPANEGAAVWRGIDALEGDEICPDGFDRGANAPCVVASVIRTSIAGVPQEQRSTLAPDALAWLPVDAPITLASDGNVALDGGGRLLWAVLHAEEAYVAMPPELDALPAGWSLTVPDEPFCRHFSNCWLFDFHRLEVTPPGGAPVVLDPGEATEVTVDGTRYRIRNSSMVARNSELLPVQCADIRFRWSWEIVALGRVS